MSRPLITMPTTWPRSPSGARVEAKGTRTWATTEVAEAMAIASARTAKPGRRGGGGRAEAGDRQQDDDELAAVDQVAERGEEDEAEPVGDLGDGDEQPGGAVGDVELVGDRREQRLRVVEVGDGRPAADREQRDQPAVDGLVRGGGHPAQATPRSPRAKSNRSHLAGGTYTWRGPGTTIGAPHPNPESRPL